MYKDIFHEKVQNCEHDLQLHNKEMRHSAHKDCVCVCVCSEEIYDLTATEKDSGNTNCCKHFKQMTNTITMVTCYNTSHAESSIFAGTGCEGIQHT